MSGLSQKKCKPCEGGVSPLTREETEKFLQQVSGWELDNEGKSINKTFTSKNFVSAMDFANAITDIAETENHHPDLIISWGKVGVSITTHAIGGLSENDFILAAKIDEV